jgi:hypothetical protein
MVSRKTLLAAIKFLVIVPTTIVAAPLGVAGVMVALLGGLDGLSATYMALSLVVSGWFGIFTLWKLLNHFHYSVEPPQDVLHCWLGLLCGSATSSFTL